MAFKLRSPAFGPVARSRSSTPATAPLRWTDPPEGTKSFALTVDDRDDPSGIWVPLGPSANSRKVSRGGKPLRSGGRASGDRWDRMRSRRRVHVVLRVLRPELG